MEQDVEMYLHRPRERKNEKENMRKKTFDEIKETLAAVNASDVEIKMS